MRILLAGVSGRDAWTHYERSVAKPVDLESDPAVASLSFTQRQLLQAVHQREACIWGLLTNGPPGKVLPWQAAAKQLQLGDWVLFHRDNFVFAKSSVLAIITTNPVFSQALWPGWHGEFIFTMTRPERAHIDKREINATIGNQARDPWQGSRLLSLDQSDQLANRLGWGLLPHEVSN